MTEDNTDRLTWLRKTLEDADLDLMREMLKVFAEELICAEADSICGAGFRERPHGGQCREPPRDREPRHVYGGEWRGVDRVPKSAQPFVATLVRTIFAQPCPEEVAAQLARAVEQLSERFPDVATMLEEAAADITAFATFPDRESIIRLVGAVLSGQHDEWQVSRRYMSIESIEKTMQPVLTVEDGLDQGVVPALMAG